MISHKYKCIHIHIPKCAGTSIEKALGHFDGHEGRNGQDHRTIRMIEQPFLTKHSVSSLSNVKEIFRRLRHKTIIKTNPKNHEVVTKEQFMRYFKFTVVRNPYSRIYSWYNSIIQDEVQLRYYRIPKDLEFLDFLKKFLKNTYMIKQQVYWLKNFEGKINLDYIGKFEKIEEVFQNISKNLSDATILFPHEKNSKTVDYKNFYKNESIDLVTKHYKDDLKFFNYKFD
jgi:hypothetical protein